MINFLKFILNLIKPLAKAVVLFSYYLYENIRPCFIFMRNIPRILIYLDKKSINKNNMNRIIPRVCLNGNSPALIRDLLISLNKIYAEVLLKTGETESLEVYLNKGAHFHNFNEIITCFLLYPAKINTSFYWSDGSRNEIEALPENKGDKSGHEVNSCKSFINDTYMPVKVVDYFSSCENNFLDIPVSTKVWAGGILKGHPPGASIICFHLPELSQKEKVGILREWDVFLKKSWVDLPHLHFIVLNYLTVSEEELLYALPNVTSSKILGYNFLEEFALVRQSDMYLGVYDKYATAVIGTDKPFMLVGEDGVDMTVSGGLKQLKRSERQVWLRHVSSPEDLYMQFRKFYVDHVI